jgi:hypothetical protein
LAVVLRAGGELRRTVLTFMAPGPKVSNDGRLLFSCNSNRPR